MKLVIGSEIFNRLVKLRATHTMEFLRSDASRSTVLPKIFSPKNVFGDMAERCQPLTLMAAGAYTRQGDEFGPEVSFKTEIFHGSPPRLSSPAACAALSSDARVTPDHLYRQRRTELRKDFAQNRLRAFVRQDPRSGSLNVLHSPHTEQALDLSVNRCDKRPSLNSSTSALASGCWESVTSVSGDNSVVKFVVNAGTGSCKRNRACVERLVSSIKAIDSGSAENKRGRFTNEAEWTHYPSKSAPVDGCRANAVVYDHLSFFSVNVDDDVTRLTAPSIDRPFHAQTLTCAARPPATTHERFCRCRCRPTSPTQANHLHTPRRDRIFSTDAVDDVDGSCFEGALRHGDCGYKSMDACVRRRQDLFWPLVETMPCRGVCMTRASADPPPAHSNNSSSNSSRRAEPFPPGRSIHHDGLGPTECTCAGRFDYVKDHVNRMSDELSNLSSKLSDYFKTGPSKVRPQPCRNCMRCNAASLAVPGECGFCPRTCSLHDQTDTSHSDAQNGFRNDNSSSSNIFSPPEFSNIPRTFSFTGCDAKNQTSEESEFSDSEPCDLSIKGTKSGQNFRHHAQSIFYFNSRKCRSKQAFNPFSEHALCRGSFDSNVAGQYEDCGWDEISRHCDDVVLQSHDQTMSVSSAESTSPLREPTFSLPPPELALFQIKLGLSPADVGDVSKHAKSPEPVLGDIQSLLRKYICHCDSDGLGKTKYDYFNTSKPAVIPKHSGDQMLVDLMTSDHHGPLVKPPFLVDPANSLNHSAELDAEAHWLDSKSEGKSTTRFQESSSTEAGDSAGKDLEDIPQRVGELVPRAILNDCDGVAAADSSDKPEEEKKRRMAKTKLQISDASTATHKNVCRVLFSDCHDAIRPSANVGYGNIEKTMSVEDFNATASDQENLNVTDDRFPQFECTEQKVREKTELRAVPNNHCVQDDMRIVSAVRHTAKSPTQKHAICAVKTARITAVVEAVETLSSHETFSDGQCSGHAGVSGQRERRWRDRPRVHQCAICSVSCSNRGQLQGHLRTHTGERPFPCLEPGCHKMFVRNEELTRHRRIHSGERPYVCGQCGKTFSRKDHLNKHCRVHEGPSVVV